MRATSRASLLALIGISLRKQGALAEAEHFLLESLGHVEVAVEPIALNGLADLCLVIDRATEARDYFACALATSQGRLYYEARAALGLAIVDSRLKSDEDVASLEMASSNWA